ncbi:MAG: PKD domain-containing protein [Vicingaceae bacterium]|nr:PKD domain-containing protein [Vicingaceae bacterium]
MKKTNILLLLMLVFVSATFSQLTPLKNTNQLNNSSTSESCGFDHMHDMLLSSNADYRQRTEDFNNFMKSYNAPKSGATYVVPVVVHVMHKGEAVGTGSNISEVDINQGILQLNERFRKIPGSLGDGNGVDVDIEFALAVRDPNGNCTNGIVRVDMTGNSTYMNFGVRAQTSNGITDAALKATSRWNTLEYYNIYLVSEIDDNECGFGIQGYAYFASAHGQSYDGMVQLGCKFAQSGNTTLTHELGHAMNLYHTFEGDNNGNSCPSNTNCSSQGDRCCDTPPHIRSASNCVTGTNSCDGGSSKELFIHNYMDYSSDACQSEFTADQKARANAAISVTRASYLAANGNMSLVPPSTAGVDFSVSSSVVCLGSPVTFYDESTCIPNTYQNGGWPNISFLWTFDDGVNTPITSTDQNPTINFAQAGSYDVTLQITNGSGTTSLTKPGFVSVANGVQSSTCQNTSSNTGNFGYAISKVVFNTMSATSSSGTNGGWQDLTCSKNTQVTQGQNYNLEVTVNAGNSGLGLQFRVYIDYNDDGAYTAGELVLSNSITDNTSQTFTTSVNIPLTSTTGQLLRLRAISDGGTLASGCESPLLVGDVEDYGVYINPSGVPPVADFSGSPTTLCEGNTVSFTDLSTNTPTSWSWTFAGGTPSSSTAQNPTITYNTAGTYQVQLTATNAFGNDVETKVGYITVNGVPSNAGAITGSVSECNNATGVSYSIAAVNGATNYTWTVPTGATITSGQGTTAITVNYGTNSGSVTVTPSNSCGNGGLSSTSVTIAPCGSAPVADFSGSPTTLCEGNTVSFTDLSTNTPTSWSWTFAGGTPSSSTAQNPTITYNTAGTYQVQLTATNAFGNDVETKVGYITVNGVPSNAGAITGSVSECNNATGVSYSIAAVNGATNYTWTVPTGATITSGQGTTAITVNYGTNSGSVTVTPSNSCGNGGLSSTSVTIAPCGSAPVAEFSATPKNICEGETVSFTDLSSNTPTSWSWTFVGGTPSSSTSQNPTITYNTAGTYQVQLTATNAGGSDIETKSAYITVSAPTGVILDTANIRVQDCGITLSSATSIIFADIVANATGYQFEVTNTSLGFTYTSPWWYNARWIRLMDIPGVQPNTTYNVRVKAKNGRCDFGYYGASCAITTHSNPVWNTSVIDPQCGISLNDINSVIYAKPITGATNYIFEISNTTLCYVRTINLTFRYVRMSWWANSLQPNTTYDIKVKVIVNGITGNYSKVCQVTTPSSFRISIPDDEIQYVESLTSPIQLIIYPNPSQGEFVYMELKSSEDISELIVTDITGKVVHQQNLQADDYYSTVRFNEKLNSGFYFVTVISGSQKQTKKLVVK